MSKDMVVWRKKKVVELTKNAVKHVMATSNEYSKNNKIVNNDLSKALPPQRRPISLLDSWASVAMPKRMTSMLLVARSSAYA